MSTQNILRTMVDLTFLLLAVTIIVVLLKDNKERIVVDSARSDIAIIREDLNKALSVNATYFEQRLNKTDERQDSYQTSTSSRMRVIEERLLIIENNNKQSTRVVNNNINTLNNTK